MRLGETVSKAASEETAGFTDRISAVFGQNCLFSPQAGSSTYPKDVGPFSRLVSVDSEDGLGSAVAYLKVPSCLSLRSERERTKNERGLYF